MNKQKPSLVFVGLGIKFFSHITAEASANIVEAAKVYYLLNEPATIEWVKQQNESAESLESLYYSCSAKIEAYNAIAQKLIKATKLYDSICVVMYGHPLVLNLPCKITIDLIRKDNLAIDINVLPGVSAESVLYCDLGIDPGIGGVQSYEATDFVVNKKVIDPSSHLILWQVSSIPSLIKTSKNNNVSLELLKKHLLNFYSECHEVCLYEASLYAHIPPRIVYTNISSLLSEQLTTLMTVYIKPSVCVA